MDAKAIFYSEGKTLDKVKVQCKNNEAMSSIFEKFSNKIGSKVSDFDFFYKGKKVKMEGIKIEENEIYLLNLLQKYQGIHSKQRFQQNIKT